jgi:outer membrane protein assembly factor BamB
MTRKSWKYVLASMMAAIIATFGIARMSQNAVALGDERSSERAAAKESSQRPSASSNVADEKLPIDSVASQIRPGDWNQWGGSPVRNNTPEGKNIATEWKAGQFDDDTGAWKRETSKNVKWVARLGTKSNGNAAVANGKVYVGTNNGGGYLKRYPSSVDLGVLLCFNEADGKFLWQDSSEKLPTGRVNDWPEEGICSVPLIEGHRLWYVTSRGEVKCLDTEERKAGTTDEPKVIWVLDMMKKLGVQQHNMCSCGVTSVGDLLFVNTSNGIDVDHSYIPAPSAPSFMCLDKNTGKVHWTDNSPGKNILHGQWSSPSYSVIGGVPQVLFGGGDGWLYSFLGTAENDHGRPKLLWKFDCNPKTAKYSVGGQATRNHIIGAPVIYKGLVYIGVGEDPEHAEGIGHYWCIDPTKRGDVSSELVFNAKDLQHPLPPRRLQAAIPEQGDLVRPNPNSAAVWHFDHFDLNHNGKIETEETMHRTCGTAAIKNDLLFVPDFSGILHCLDAKTGKPHWNYDLYSACWGSCLIVEDKVYVGNEDGDVFIFRLSPKMEVISKKDDGMPGGIEMGSAVYTTPIVAQNTLFITSRNYLFAITPSTQVAAAK